MLPRRNNLEPVPGHNRNRSLRRRNAQPETGIKSTDVSDTDRKENLNVGTAVTASGCLGNKPRGGAER